MMAVMRRSDVTARVYFKTGVLPIAVKTVITAVKNKRVSVFSISIMPIIIRSQLRMQTVYHCHLRLVNGSMRIPYVIFSRRTDKGFAG